MEAVKKKVEENDIEVDSLLYTLEVCKKYLIPGTKHYDNLRKIRLFLKDKPNY